MTKSRRLKSGSNLEFFTLTRNAQVLKNAGLAIACFESPCSRTCVQAVPLELARCQ